MTISVIIPTYNRVDSLTRTLHYVLSSNRLPDEIILVDQTQDYGLAQRIEALSAQSEIISLLHNDVPSLTKARNSGLDAAKGDVVVFMDDDVDVARNTMQILERLFSADDKLGMISGLNEADAYIAGNSALGILFGKSSYCRRFQGHVTRAVYGRFPIQIRKAVSTEWAMGFFFAVRKSVIDKFKLRFDENLRYYAYAEDLDFTYRYYQAARAEGIHCVVTPEIMVRHNVSHEYRLPQRKAIFQMVLHRRYLSNKLYGTWRSMVACQWADIGSALSAALHCANWKDYVAAMKFAKKHSSDIKSGNFHYEEFS